MLMHNLWGANEVYVGGKQGDVQIANSPPPVQPLFKNLCQEFYLEAHQLVIMQQNILIL